MPRKSIPAIPVGVLRVHGAHSVFRLFRIFNYFFSRAISPSAAGISRALSQSVPISIFHFAVFPRLEEQQRDFVAHKTDRKSTRLNSSHSQISYAVFCLKKKNLTQGVSIYFPEPALTIYWSQFYPTLETRAAKYVALHIVP